MSGAPVELLLIRHAAADHGGRLVGRTDVPAILPDEAALERLRGSLGGVSTVFSSAALRCRMTAEALFPARAFVARPDLWEQDFGQDEGRAFGDLPDLGPMSREALALHRSPGGESFLDMCARVVPILRDAVSAHQDGRIAVVAHAGTVRAALGDALGEPAAGLAFEIAPLSATLLRYVDGAVSIVRTNASLES